MHTDRESHSVSGRCPWTAHEGDQVLEMQPARTTDAQATGESARALGILLVPVMAALLLVGGLSERPANAQPQSSAPDQAILLTIFLRHDQTKTVDEINEHLKKTGWYDKFPPEGVEIVSWYVMMGIGQVVTLRVPADKLRAVNRVIEQSAWGGYHTEFYPTYDFKPVWDAMEHHRP